MTAPAKPRPRRLPRVAIVVLLGLLAPPIGFAAFAAYQLASDEARPAARVPAETDLPPFPAPDENGWTLIAAEDEDAFDAELPTEAHGWEDLDAERIRAAIERWSPPVEASDLAFRAFAAPRFVAGCSPAIASPPCAGVATLRAHHLASALALRRVVDGAPDEAVDRLEHLLSLDRDQALGAQTLASMVLGHILPLDTVARIGDLLTLLESDPTTASALAPSLRALDARLEATRPTEWTLEHAVDAEWIRSQDTLDRLAERRHHYGHSYFSRAVADYHLALLAYARDVDHVPEPAPPAIAGWRGTLSPLEHLTAESTARVVPAALRHARRRDHDAEASILELRARIAALLVEAADAARDVAVPEVPDRAP